MYFFLSPEDSRDSFPNNNEWDFTTILPKQTYLPGKWLCALTEIYYSESITEDLYVFCDLCEDSVVKSTSLPVLKIVCASGLIFSPYFMKVTRSELTQVRIYIRNTHMKAPSVRSEQLRCTLVIKPAE